MTGGLPSPPAPLLRVPWVEHTEKVGEDSMQTLKVEPLTKQEYFDTVQD
jgi:hypothetical protein